MHGPLRLSGSQAAKKAKKKAKKQAKKAKKQAKKVTRTEHALPRKRAGSDGAENTR